ncbi:hypothetical protein BANRA_00012 [Klebsiella pneumoniae]|uniref:Uncharacterized protein n=1 Tax=Klebsiella pneumoniae TaxID=573 RepID=A0ABD7UCJ9_KLEPN|nr:hypothetical protein BANRA_00012 [Klebsiella pneumoniae]
MHRQPGQAAPRRDFGRDRHALLSRTKTFKVNIKALFLQLPHAAMRPLIGRGIEENFHRRVRENYRSHIATVGDKPRQFAEGALAAQRFANARKSRHFRGRVRDLLSANFATDIFPSSTTSGLPSVEIKRTSRWAAGHQRLFGLHVDMMMQRRQRQNAVDRA